MEGRERNVFSKSGGFHPSTDFHSPFPALLYRRSKEMKVTIAATHTITSPIARPRRSSLTSLQSQQSPKTQQLSLFTQRVKNTEGLKGTDLLESGTTCRSSEVRNLHLKGSFSALVDTFATLPVTTSHNKENSENLATFQSMHMHAKSISIVSTLPALSEPCQHPTSLFSTLYYELPARKSAEWFFAFAVKEKGQYRYQQFINGLTEAWKLVESQRTKAKEMCRIGVKLAKALVLHSSDFATANYLLSESYNSLQEMSFSKLALKVQFCRGLLQFHSGRYTEAAVTLIRIATDFSYIQCYPKYCWQVRYYLIRALLESNRKDDAIAYDITWNKEQPATQKDKSLQVLISALIFTRQGQYIEAECSHLTSKSAYNMPWSIYTVYNLHQLGYAYSQRKLYREAMSILATAHQMYASHFPTVRDFCDLLATRAALFARLCFFTTEIKLRITADNTYASYYPRSIEKAENAVKLAISYRDSKQLKAAEKTAIQSIDLAERIDPSGIVLAQGLSVLAEIHHRSGRTDYSLPLLERAQSIYGSVESVDLQCIVNYRLMGDFTASVQHPSTACSYYTKACSAAFRAVVLSDTFLYQVEKAGEALIRLRQYRAAEWVFRKLAAGGSRWRISACAALHTVAREKKEFDIQEIVGIRALHGTGSSALKRIRTVYQP